MHFIFFSFGGEGWGGRLFEVGRLKSTFWGLGWWGGRLFEAGHLLNFSTFRKSSTKKLFSYDVQIKAIEIFLQGKVLI